MGCRVRGGRDWPLGSGRRWPGTASGQESTAVPGVEEAPTPAVSRRCGTWKPRPGPGVVPGKPTVRKAQFPGGNRMTRQANAGGRKAAGTRDAWLAPPLAVPDNWPDTGLVPGPERALTRVR